MTFNSVNFVIFFLIVYGVCVLSRHRFQNWFLLVASYVFYGAWDWRFLGLIFLTTCVDYFCGMSIAAAPGGRRARWLLAFSISVNLGILAFFKYFNFFSDSFVSAMNGIGLAVHPVTLKILLPVGISFYTFQSMSYTIDVYRGRLRPARSFFDYALFVSFFPQLVAGPIERASHLLGQVENPRTITYAGFREGCWLILLGYFKKVVVADNLADIANAVFNNPSQYHGPAVLLGIYAFALQIYGDFSGYSDIARGTAKLMGFDLMQNFRMPYFARNPQDFWRRWHISLSTWLRDYLYVSLGGNRRGELMTYRNLMLTMLLGGLWHGAAWNFVLWGLYHGFLLVLHRRFCGKFSLDAPTTPAIDALNILLMFHATCFGWILFRINAIGDLPLLLRNLFSAGSLPAGWLWAFLFFAAPLALLNWHKERTANMLAVKALPAPARLCVYSLLVALIVACGKSAGSQFIYFQF